MEEEEEEDDGSPYDACRSSAPPGMRLNACLCADDRFSVPFF